MSMIHSREPAGAVLPAHRPPGAKDRRLAWSALGVVVALGFPMLPTGNWMRQFASTGHLVAYEALWWAVVAIFVGLVRVAERRPLASIGVRPMRRADVLVGIATGVAILAGLAGIHYLVFPLLGLSVEGQMGQLLASPLWWRCILIIRAAVSEEVLYRGYAIERLTDLTGHRGVAAVLSCVAFTVAHVGWWGWGHLLVAGLAGAALTALYLWRRNLGVNILAHFVVDGLALLAG